MATIVLSTLNASYGHASLALRYLHANLGSLFNDAVIREFVIKDRAMDIAESIVRDRPRIVGFGVYVWNTEQTRRVISILKRVAPDVVIVVGGPEVSHENDAQEICALADYVIENEADLAFAELCRKILGGQRPLHKVIRPPQPDPAELVAPYSLYTENDIEHRAIYVEASRGCPYKCEFCLSSLANGVRKFSTEVLLEQIQSLIDRGARQFRFIDRTFNLNHRIASRILEFFLERIELGLFIHFEMVPDRFPHALREIVARFPRGSIQFEIGIQTFDEATGERISRRQDLTALEDNLLWLREHSNVHIHADLIAGLPGEDMASFAAGFDRLLGLAPHEIQVGVLKRLRGTPIVRHTVDWEMRYNDAPPYEVLSTKVLSFLELADIKRFARAWDLIANSGNFPSTAPLIWRDNDSAFESFMALTRWMHEQTGGFVSISLSRLSRLMLRFLTEVRELAQAEVGHAIANDYVRPGRNAPAFLKPYLQTMPQAPSISPATPKRQARHLGH